MELHVLRTVCGRVHNSFCPQSKKQKKKKKKEMEATAVTPGEILQDVVFFLFFLLHLLHCRRWIHLSSTDYKLQAPRSKHLLVVLSFSLSLSVSLNGNCSLCVSCKTQDAAFPSNGQEVANCIFEKKKAKIFTFGTGIRNSTTISV